MGWVFLVFPCYYNKQAGKFIKYRNLFLTVLEAREFYSAESASGAGLLALSKMVPVAASSHGKMGRGGAKRLSQVQGLIPCMKSAPS